jgi:Flp pilus assembly protein TadD
MVRTEKRAKATDKQADRPGGTGHAALAENASLGRLGNLAWASRQWNRASLSRKNNARDWWQFGVRNPRSENAESSTTQSLESDSAGVEKLPNMGCGNRTSFPNLLDFAGFED